MTPPLLTAEQMNEALAGFAAHVPPASLYRFHSPTGTPALTEGKLKITPPSEFNDPFEISPGIVTDSLAADDIRRSFLSPSSLAREVRRDKYPNEQAYSDWVENTVLNRRDLWAEFFANLRRSVTKATSAVYGLSCFSAFPEAVLNGPIGIRHWAMYGGPVNLLVAASGRGAMHPC